MKGRKYRILSLAIKREEIAKRWGRERNTNRINYKNVKFAEEIVSAVLFPITRPCLSC